LFSAGSKCREKKRKTKKGKESPVKKGRGARGANSIIEQKGEGGRKDVVKCGNHGLRKKTSKIPPETPIWIGEPRNKGKTKGKKTKRKGMERGGVGEGESGRVERGSYNHLPGAVRFENPKKKITLMKSGKGF